MNKEILLKKILQNEELKEKYWPEINPIEHNSQTIMRSDNKYLKALSEFLSDNTDNYSFKAITQIFNI